MKYRVEVNLSGAGGAYLLMRGDEIIKRSDSATQLRELALALIGKEATADLVNRQIQAYTEVAGWSMGGGRATSY
jgi:hypothetical protein